MNKQELIERIEDFPCEASLVTEMIRINKNTLLGLVKELDLPQPIKLKDVIARIKIFDVGTQKVWLNEILDELGSDYGTLKYKAGYEQGKLEGEWVGQQLKDADKIRQELNKPVVPQFVADWIERSKQEKRNIRNALNNGGEKMRLWFLDLENYDTFARAWLDGYTVEEKLYKVVMPNVSSSGGVLTHIKHDDSWIWIDTLETIIEGQTHTRKELEEAGFGWMFDCPGIEVREVENE